MMKELNIDMAEQSFKAIAYLLTLLLIISLTSAVTWEQYTPSPTTESLEQVYVFDNGMGIVMNSIPSLTLRYDGSFNQITSLTELYDLTGWTYINSDKTGNKLFHLYANTSSSHNNIKIFQYDVVTNTYSGIYNSSSKEFYTQTINLIGIGCVYADGTCYVGPENVSGTYGIRKFYPINNLLYNSATYLIPMSSEDEIMASSGYGSIVYKWNGVAFTSASTQAIGNLQKHFYYTPQNRAFIQEPIGTDYAWFYNYTLGTFSIQGLSLTGVNSKNKAFTKGAYIYYLLGDDLKRIPYANVTSYEDVTTFAASSCYGDYNDFDLSATGIVTCAGGLLYVYDAGANVTDYYSFTVNAGTTPNPSIYNTTTTFWAVPHMGIAFIPYADITVNITNSTGDWAYSWQWINIQNNQVATNAVDSIMWSDFGAGTYYVNVLAEGDVGTATYNYTWTIYPNGSNSLIIVVYNTTGSPLENILITVSNSISFTSEQDYTDINGQVIFLNGVIGNNLLLTADGTSSGYPLQTATISHLSGMQSYWTITLLNAVEYGTGSTGIPGSGITGTGRNSGCTMPGVWLCGNLSITGIGSGCVNDSDCLSDRCASGTCSSFNWTRCDIQGVPRGQYCVINESIKGFFARAENIILGSFIAVIILIIIIFFILLLRRK